MKISIDRVESPRIIEIRTVNSLSEKFYEVEMIFYDIFDHNVLYIDLIICEKQALNHLLYRALGMNPGFPLATIRRRKAEVIMGSMVQIKIITFSCQNLKFLQ